MTSEEEVKDQLQFLSLFWVIKFNSYHKPIEELKRERVRGGQQSILVCGANHCIIIEDKEMD